MKKLAFLVTLILFIGNVSNAQSAFTIDFDYKINSGDDYIHFFDGTTDNSKTIVYYKSEKLFESSYILYGEQKIKLSKVKFFENSTGYFANVKNNKFARRIEKGTFNLYKHDNSYYSPGYSTASGGYVSGGNIKRESYFYNAGLGDVKKLKYSNLVVDLKASKSAMALLEKSKKRSDLSKIIYIGAAIITGVGLYQMEAAEDPTIAYGMVVGGITTASFRYFYLWSKPNYNKQALSAYNKDFIMN
jgi:hypothetical protein